MASKADDALAKVKQLLTRANSQSTSDARRTFYEHLISICAYPSYDCKAFFGTLVAKHFREFEDLQDKAIDAILDLCEDDEERVRIIGIKGLGATAKADSRWVRGNVGVLLQLLECPPRELRLIHDQLFALLSISPSDVFAVMLDDIKANEDTGASRKNIIAFLTRDASSRLERLFESGDNVEAEEVLEKGLEDVLPSLELADQSAILILLGSLPKYSGSSGSGTKAYIRLVTRSTKRGSGSEKTAPVVKAMAAYIARKSPVEPMDGLLFAADHGTALVTLALEKRDESAIKVVEKTLEWVEKASTSLSTKDGQALARDIVDGYLRGLKYYAQDHRTYYNDGQSKTTEILLYTLYQFFVIKDNRREMISKAHQTALLDLSDEARQVAKNSQGIVRRELDSIYELVKVIENDHKSLPRGLVPSWKAVAPPAPRHTSPPRSTSTVKKEHSMSSTRSSPPRSRPPPATEPASSRASELPKPTIVPTVSHAVSTSIPALEPKPSISEQPVSVGAISNTAPSASKLDSSTTTTQPTPPNAAIPSHSARAPTNTLSLAQRISGGRPVFDTSSRTSLSGTELLSGPSVQSTAIAGQPNRSTNQAGVELLPQAPVANPTPTREPSSVLPAQGSSARPTSQPRSLIERLEGGPKRSREETLPSTPSGTGNRSLMDRIGSSTDTRTPKRPREDTQPSSAPVNGTRSLLSRMGSTEVAASPTPPITTKPGLSIRQTPLTTVQSATPTPTPKTMDQTSAAAQSSLNILRRASRPTPPTVTPAPRPSTNFESQELLPGATPTNSSTPTTSLNIRSRAAQTNTPPSSAPPPTRPILNIRSSSSGATDGSGVRRKGRGFQVDSDGDALMVLPDRPAPPAHASRPATNGNGFGVVNGRGGDLASRLGARTSGR